MGDLRFQAEPWSGQGVAEGSQRRSTGKRKSRLERGERWCWQEILHCCGPARLLSARGDALLWPQCPGMRTLVLGSTLALSLVTSAAGHQHLPSNAVVRQSDACRLAPWKHSSATRGSRERGMHPSGRHVQLRECCCVRETIPWEDFVRKVSWIQCGRCFSLEDLAEYYTLYV